MAFDEGLATRLRELFAGWTGVTERKLCGGLAFMVHGYMFVGVLGDTLMARVGQDRYAQTLKRRHVREMDFTGKPMKGFVFVDPPGFESDHDLARWAEECRAFVSSLQP